MTYEYQVTNVKLTLWQDFFFFKRIFFLKMAVQLLYPNLKIRIKKVKKVYPNLKRGASSGSAGCSPAGTTHYI